MSKDNSWIEALNPGDLVVVSSWNWTGWAYKASKVEKITPTGLIRVDGALYKKDGRSRSGGSEILNPNDEEVMSRLKEYTEKRFIMSVVNKMGCVRYLTMEQAQEICRVMGWSK